MLQFGAEYNIDFVFSKDGAFITPENLAKFDAVLFYTSGDPTDQPRNGLGDNYPLMTAAGKDALLKAIREGKGFVGIHSAADTFSGPSGAAHSETIDPYARMLGAGCKGVSSVQKRTVLAVDKSFPGMEQVPANFAVNQEWYFLTHLQKDLHVILARESGAALDSKPPEPVAWARMEGKGRVYYTSLGHDEETWQNPVFRQMLLGACAGPPAWSRPTWGPAPTGTPIARRQAIRRRRIPRSLSRHPPNTRFPRRSLPKVRSTSTWDGSCSSTIT